MGLTIYRPELKTVAHVQILMTHLFLALAIPIVAAGQTDMPVASTATIPAATDETYSITITVRNIRNDKGVIRFKFYDDSTPFPHDTGFLRMVVPKTEMKGDSITVTYHGFTSKNMGIALQDDENSDMKLDMGWFLPKEGHAFSDYYHATMLRKPVYHDFDFVLTGHKKVVMRMRYY
ncbi:MAG: DUF2141 domain-containing protein [Cyclobacteriaceae bacterium]|nr:DUF2141 domain-containing protein [Cyclobacteriaceae bacterium]